MSHSERRIPRGGSLSHVPRHPRPLTVRILSALPLLICASALPGSGAERQANPIPPSWEVLPIPRHADYGAPDDFVELGKVAIIRKEGGPYQTVRDEKTELVGDSTITEEESVRILGEHGVVDVDRLSDDRASYADYSTLILLGSPKHNRQTARLFGDMKLSFDAWDDPRTPEDDFTDWSDFGKEGYLLKVGRAGEQNIVILAGHDFDDSKQRFHGAGTFYALQSFRQLLVVDGATVRVKTVEIADRPLLDHRGCMSGFDPRKEKQWRDIELLPRIKSNQNVYWYGNSLGAYNSQAAGKFRYPWTPEQLELFGAYGKYCRERYVTMVFCMNPDHFNVDWAAAKTFDGKTKDPLHYDPDHRAEPEFREMWAKLGYEVKNDIDILAAKFSQIHRVIPGVMIQMMNEGDGFGLFNEADQKLFNTKTGDAKQDAINYGRARAKFLAALYRRYKKLCPDGNDFMPLCPPGQLCYQLVLERGDAYSREFLGSLGATLKEEGLQDVMPLLTTGGGTAAEVITGAHLDRFREWSNGCRVLLHDNNFAACAKVGAYETDPKGPRSAHQTNPDYPAGYRDPQLYRRMWGTVWNGVPDQVVLGWCQSQFMWNMLALDRQKVNALATRKVSSAVSYALVKSYLEEFDNPAAYLPDNPPPYRVKVISDRVTFPAEGWKYVVRYTDARRKECQRLRDKLGRLLPELEAVWENPVEKRASLDELGYSAYSFSSVYLAYGYVRGWEKPGSESPGCGILDERLEGAALRDLYLEADSFQELYFAGPDVVDGKKPINNHYYSGTMNYIYTDGQPFTVPKTVAEAKTHTDIWKDGLEARFFAPVSSVALADLPDQGPRLAAGWGAVGEDNGQKFRHVASKAHLAINAEATGRLLVRARLGTHATARSQSTAFGLSTGEQHYQGVVCKPRWFNWLLPEGVGLTGVTLQADGPIRVYDVEIYRQKDVSKKAAVAETRLRTRPVVSGNLRGYRDWSREQWTRELEAERVLGFDLLWLSHLQGGVETSSAAAHDTAEPEDKIRMVLDLCERLNMQVILSMGSTSGWYGKLDLEGELQVVGNRIDLIGRRYGDHPAFHAWYIPHEIYVAEGPLGDYVHRLFPALVQRCRAATPGKPVTLSPFFILDQDRVFGDFRYVAPAEYRDYWTRLIKSSGIDIIMMQDSGEHFSYVTNEQRRPFFAAMRAACQAAGARFWANVEVAEAVCPSIEEYARLYGRIHHTQAKGLPWRAVPMDRLAGKLRLAAEYAERIVSWGYFQYGRPTLGPEASEWYERYRQYYASVAVR